jgi:hypothetical protein
MTHTKRAQDAGVGFIVFLNRGAGGLPQFVPYRGSVVRRFQQRGSYGSVDSLPVRFAAIDPLQASAREGR